MSSAGRRVAQTGPLGPGSPLECALGARPLGLHSSRCCQLRLPAPAGGVGRLPPGEWRVSLQRLGFKATTERLQRTTHLWSPALFTGAD